MRRLLLVKEIQISQVKEFSTFLCMEGTTFPWWFRGKEFSYQKKKKKRIFLPMQETGVQSMVLISGWGRSPGEGNGNWFPVFLPGKFHGHKNLLGCSPWGWVTKSQTQLSD